MNKNNQTTGTQLLFVAERVINSGTFLVPGPFSTIVWRGDAEPTLSVEATVTLADQYRLGHFSVVQATLCVEEPEFAMMISVDRNWRKDLLANDDFARHILDTFIEHHPLDLRSEIAV